MVHNLFQILDESEIKNVAECIMPKKTNYRKDCQRKSNRLTWVNNEWDSEEEEFVSYQTENKEYKPLPPKINWWFEKWKTKENQRLEDLWCSAGQLEKYKDEDWDRFEEQHLEEILDYLGVIPFIPCMMFNISPNWKGQLENGVTRKIAIKKFCKVIDTYLQNCNRYGKWKYCIESGSEDNFIHAHIVAEINPKVINSVLNGKNSHIRKGNHVAEIRKIWDKEMPEGYVGYLKGKFAIQSIILRNEILRDDKLKYLIEENKPDGHKNKRDLGLLFGEL